MVDSEADARLGSTGTAFPMRNMPLLPRLHPGLVPIGSHVQQKVFLSVLKEALVRATSASKYGGKTIDVSNDLMKLGAQASSTEVK